MLALLTALSSTLPAQAPSPRRSPVLVELFTSLGCPDCSAADRLLHQIDAEQPFADAEVVVLSEHPDLFDGAGLRDPFSSRQFTDRLRDYAALIGGNLIARTERAQYKALPVARSANATEVYLPEFIVDGIRGFAGSDRNDLERGIREGAVSPKIRLRVQAERRGRQTRILIRTSQIPDGSLYVALAREAVISRATTGASEGGSLSQVAVVYWLRQVGEMRRTAEGYEREIVENVHPGSRIVAFVAKPGPGSADDAVTLTEKVLGRNVQASGPGRVTGIGVGFNKKD